MQCALRCGVMLLLRVSIAPAFVCSSIEPSALDKFPCMHVPATIEVTSFFVANIDACVFVCLSWDKSHVILQVNQQVTNHVHLEGSYGLQQDTKMYQIKMNGVFEGCFGFRLDTMVCSKTMNIFLRDGLVVCHAPRSGVKFLCGVACIVEFPMKFGAF